LREANEAMVPTSPTCPIYDYPLNYLIMNNDRCLLSPPMRRRAVECM
jgi:hypothetical protein